MGKSSDTAIEKGDIRTSSANVLLWMLCLTSIGFSAYTSLSQTYLEDRIRQFSQINDRVSIIEAQLQTLPQQWLDRATDPIFTEPKEYDNIANVVRKLSAEVTGMSRLRRDVTHLKMKRGERQTQAGECQCPPGIYIRFVTLHR